jgi:hypothetical protein
MLFWSHLKSLSGVVTFMISRRQLIVTSKWCFHLTNSDMCEDCGLIEFKVPLVRPSTQGVPAHREGRY